jgi:hypothetical protein
MRVATPTYEPAFMATAIGMVRAGPGATLLPSSAFNTFGTRSGSAIQTGTFSGYASGGGNVVEPSVPYSAPYANYAF